LYNNRKNVGKINNSKGMAAINPPITAIASGCCILVVILSDFNPEEN
jgi:hypothetical protein